MFASKCGCSFIINEIHYPFHPLHPILSKYQQIIPQFSKDFTVDVKPVYTNKNCKDKRIFQQIMIIDTLFLELSNFVDIFPLLGQQFYISHQHAFKFHKNKMQIQQRYP